MIGNIQLIAEVKTASPFGWRSSYSWEELFAIAATHGDLISIHTDPRWEGSMDLVRKARAQTDKPILAKGIHATDDDIARAIDAGADWALCVGRVPSVHADRCIIEPYTLAELVNIPSGLRALWNSRDLATGGRKRETFGEARALRAGWLCQASNLRTRDDIHPRAEAVLVGAHLPDFIASLG